MSAEEQGGKAGILLKLFLLGFVLMVVGVVVLVAAALVGGGNTSTSTGVILIVGIIPIVVGAGPYAFFAILIAAVLTIIAFAVFVWMRRQAR